MIAPGRSGGHSIGATMNLYRWLAALAMTGIACPAFGQYCGQWDPNNPGCWQQQRDEEDKRRREAEEESRKREEEYSEQRQREAENAEERSRSEPQRREAARQNAETEAALLAMRAQLLAMPPLPPDRNPLLGRWRVAGSDKSGAKDDWSQLQEMVANPGGAMCTILFGEGVTEFLPGSWASIDSLGNDSLGKIQYRMHDSRAYALPDQGIPLLGFEIVDQSRIREVRLPDCALVRVGAQPTAAPAARAAEPAAAGVATPVASARSPRKPIDPNSPLGRGVRLHGEKDFQPALQQLLAAEQSDPNDPRVYVYLADTYLWLGMDAESNQAAERAKRLDPSAFEILR